MMQHGDVWLVKVDGVETIVRVDAGEFLPPRFNAIFFLKFGTSAEITCFPLTGKCQNALGDNVDVEMERKLYP